MKPEYMALLFMAVAAVILIVLQNKGDKKKDNPQGSPWLLEQSIGVPLYPQKHPEGWVIEIPQAGASVHYVTMPTGWLTGKTAIKMRFRVEMADGVRIVPRTNPKQPSMLTLYFQRAGDPWTAKGMFEAYRWYAHFATVMPLTAGDHEVFAKFSENWTAVETSSHKNQPEEFEAAMQNAGRIGFVLGGGTGLGHGVYATGPARLVILSYEVA